MPEAASWQELAGLLCACCPDLAALHLNSSDSSDIHNIHSAFMRVLTLPRLSTLEVHNCDINSIDAMMSAIGSLSSLEYLRLEKITVDGDDDSIDVTPLASLSRLQGLSLLNVGEGSFVGLGTVLHSCPRLVLLRVSAMDILQSVELFNSSLKRLELADVSLSHGLPDVLSCFPSIQEVVVGGHLQLHDDVLASEEEVAAAAHRIWQLCSMLSAWPVDNHGANLSLYGPSLDSPGLRLHANTSLLRALAPLKGSSFVSSTTALQLHHFRFDDSGVMAALCDVFPSVEFLAIYSFSSFNSSSCSMLVEAVVGFPCLRELRIGQGGLLPRQGVIIAACIAAKGRCGGGRLVLHLHGIGSKDLSACQVVWAGVARQFPGFCDVSIEA